MATVRLGSAGSYKSLADAWPRRPRAEEALHLRPRGRWPGGREGGAGGGEKGGSGGREQSEKTKGATCFSRRVRCLCKGSNPTGIFKGMK